MNVPNWIDLEKSLADMYWQLYHAIQSEDEQKQYDYATGFCSDCPGVEGEHHNKGVCCKEDGTWNENRRESDEWLDRQRAVKDAIRAAVSPDVLQSAKPKINQT